MIANDRLENERANAKNAVEEYVYAMRDKLNTEYEPYVKEEVGLFGGVKLYTFYFKFI